MASPKSLSVDRLRQLVAYDPSTGHLTWREDRMCGRYGKQFAARAGQRAGSVTEDGRIQVRIEGRNYKGHIVAWAIAHGAWPIFEIDHEDTDAANNRLDNLRAATRRINAQNLRRARRTNALGVLGVVQNGRKFIAQLCINGTTIYLGSFATKEAAHERYVAEKRVHHEGCTI